MTVGLLWSLSSLALVATALPNDSLGQGSPRDAASRFLSAWNERRWEAAAALLDLDRFDRFRRDFVTRASRQSEGPEPTVQELQKRNPGLPRDVAEYQVELIREARRRYQDPTRFEFANVRSLADLRGLGAGDAAARWLESRDPRYAVRLQYEAAGCRPPDDLDQIPSPTRRLVGVVEESDSAAYAVVKEERPAEDTPDYYGGDLTVIQLTRIGAEWRIVPRGDLLPDLGVGVEPCH